MSNTPIPAKVLLAAASIVMIWPMAFSVSKIGLDYFSPLALATFRLLSAVIVMSAYVWWRGYRLPRGRDLLLLIGSGVCGVGWYAYMLNLAVQTITAGEAAFLVAINPVFVVLMGAMLYGERVGRRALIGMLIAIIGVGIITLESEHGLSLEWGTFDALIAGLGFSLFVMLQKPLLDHYPQDMIGAYCSIFGGLVFLPFLPQSLPEITVDLPFKAYATFLFLGLVSTAAGFLVWAYTLKHLSRVQASSIVYLLPFSASIHAIWLLDEFMPLSAWLGGLLVMVGVIMVNLRRQKEFKPHASNRQNVSRWRS